MLNTCSRPSFSWDDEHGNAICVLTRGNKVYYGCAYCSTQDQDMKSEKVGCEIAYARATIKFLQAEKERVKIQREALKHLLSTFPKSDIDTQSKAYKRLTKEIYNLKLDFCDAQEQIDLLKNYLREYINNKDALYQRIREKRKAKSD